MTFADFIEHTSPNPLPPGIPLTKCPECRTTTGTFAAPRPGGLPWFQCPRCGHKEYAPDAPDAQYERLRFGMRWGHSEIPPPSVWDEAFRRRLADPVSREGEIRSLVAIGPEAVPVLSEVLEQSRPSNSRAAEGAVEALGRIGGAEATECLLRVLAQQEREAVRDRRVRQPIFAAFWLALFGALLILNSATDRNWLSGVMWGVWGSGAWVFRRAIFGVRSRAVSALGAFQEPRAVGPLAMAYRDEELRQTAEPILLSLIPRAGAEHVESWRADERAAIVGLLQSKNTEVKKRALPLITTFAGSEALPLVEAIASSEDRELAQLAKEALPTIRARVEAERDRATLLRAPSETCDSQELLRSASGEAGPSNNLLIATELEEDLPS